MSGSQDVAEYEAQVRAAAALIGLPLAEDEVAGVAAQYALTAGLAARIMAAGLDPTDEPAPVFRP